jgi:hypothetical protein
LRENNFNKVEMDQHLNELFNDKELIAKIQNKLPFLFHIAELESSRAGKVGMEVGSVREKIIIALLIFKLGEENINTEIPITEAEKDVEVNGVPISIKTISGKKLKGVKLIWTVDAEKAIEFSKNYTPSCDMIFIHIKWNSAGGLFYISKEIQNEILNKIGRQSYIKLPKAGTNPRGVEITETALLELINHNSTIGIHINWNRENIDFKPFNRWVELWAEE